mmetsp:Transcript_55349/g.129530  ORF Transcript_55349/g.129530 Transcript_55349/m.129530 type:complete len:443 (-) Transcript_55349:52-1380(-)
MTSKAEEVGGSTAATPAGMNRSPALGGLAWSQCALVQIEGQDAYAKFGGGGHGDVPTVRGAAIIADGGNVVWQLKIEKKFASSPMRIGVQHPQVRVGLNWNDRMCVGKAWYMDSQGDMYDGPNIYTETDAEYKAGDLVQISLGYNRLTYSINGTKVRGELEGIKGEVQLAVQLFHKGDRIVLVSQHVPSEEEEEELEQQEEQRHQQFLEKKQKDMEREERELQEKRDKEEEAKKAIKGGGPIQSVANIVHGDYSLVSAPKRLQLLCEPPKVNDTYKKLYGDRPLIPADDMQALKDKRYCIINVWRNINSYPVMELPLAMCDGATVPLDDLVTFEVRYQDRTGENYLAYPSKPPPGKEGAHHRWVYYPGMVKDEAILLKCWDSKGSDFAGLDPETGKPAINATPESGPYRATMALHTAFQDPSSPPDALSRESIEVRCIAFYD